MRDVQHSIELRAIAGQGDGARCQVKWHEAVQQNRESERFLRRVLLCFIEYDRRSKGSTSGKAYHAIERAFVFDDLYDEFVCF